ncbi:MULTISPECIES: LLM class flavin-dependent oxidoreductase [unclassified Nocardioides]|uniref:LLM class flavin-dependent oxidoreductase n=1 Tax=unclassified Nocardioides TaxID=2615069 RepID=UPI001F24C714|nr:MULTISPECIES: LLM class flavin-dependent oxidoreductase [unclassified Nocardioides]
MDAMPMSIGMFIPEAMPSQEAVDFAVGLEDAGFDTAWFTEIDRDPFVRCAATVARTQRIKVATGIAQWTRSPVAMAMAAAELHQLSDGRFNFGLGAGTAQSNQAHHNIDFDRPVSRMAEYLQVLHGTWVAQSEPFEFLGEYFTVRGLHQTVFSGARPPLFLAAVGDNMLRLAARLADGVLLNPSTSAPHVKTHVLPQVRAAAAQAGRSLDGFQRAVCLRASVDTDRALARERARQGIAEYGRYPIHLAQYARYGFGREAECIRDALAKNDTPAAVAAVSDDMVDLLGIAGTPDEVRRAIRQWEGVVDSVALMPPSHGLSLDELRANCWVLADVFAAS